MHPPLGDPGRQPVAQQSQQPVLRRRGRDHLRASGRAQDPLPAVLVAAVHDAEVPAGLVHHSRAGDHRDAVPNGVVNEVRNAER
ncbi:hypothetical protein GCM10017744_008260 [Streptomyces antimycoticus]